MASTPLPRLVVAAPASGHGKTTVATGIMAALRSRGLAVSGHKVGPDFIDPGYHELATGRPGRNLDPFLVGSDLVAPLLLHGARTPSPADVAVIEGVMGLYDGQLGGEGFASTAHVATLTESPVVLVVDVSHASRSVAAVVHGMRTFDPAVRIVGVVLNKAGSPRHAREVTDALDAVGLPVLGVLPRDAGVVAPSRHLGLVPVAERPEAVAALDRLAEQVAAHVDLDALVGLAHQAPPLSAEPWDALAALGKRVATATRPIVAVAGGRAFTFRYAETDELLQAAGCDVAVFDPLTDVDLPTGTSALYLCGGFPEVYVERLAANRPLLTTIGDAVRDGLPTVAECAGLLYLCRTLDGRPMAGVVEADATMTPRLTLGYRHAVVPTETLAGPAGTRLTGHEFHRTTVSPPAGSTPAFLLDGHPDGFAGPAMSASYLHVHWAGHPQLAARLTDAESTRPPNRRDASNGRHTAHFGVVSRPFEASRGLGMRHHGDREVGEGLLDFAVNVHPGGPPSWLIDALRTSVDDVARYPDAEAAERAVAARHGRSPDEVLATAGAAEAFTLVARSRRWQRAVVVQPQFTEPLVALTEAGIDVDHVHALPEDDFRLPLDRVPDDADLVVVGNPTNPTAVLHPRDDIRALLRPGRTVLVDEAFIDTIVGEPQTLVADRSPGLLVVRSLTKLWAVPGVRAGYVVGEPQTLAGLRRQQPPWSVSAAAIAAMTATATPRALAEARRRAETLDADRSRLTDGLTRLGLPHVPGAGAFVLVRVPRGTHARLRHAGIAVRRCDTFPGLDDTWVRIAVRPTALTDHLLETLARSLEEPA